MINMLLTCAQHMSQNTPPSLMCSIQCVTIIWQQCTSIWVTYMLHLLFSAIVILSSEYAVCNTKFTLPSTSWLAKSYKRQKVAAHRWSLYFIQQMKNTQIVACTFKHFIFCRWQPDDTAALPYEFMYIGTNVLYMLITPLPLYNISLHFL